MTDFWKVMCVFVYLKYYLSRCHVQVLYVFLPLLLKHILFPIFLLPLLFFWTWSILVYYCCQCSARYWWAHCSLWYPTHSLLGRETTHILQKISNLSMDTVFNLIVRDSLFGCMFSALKTSHSITIAFPSLRG